MATSWSPIRPGSQGYTQSATLTCSLNEAGPPGAADGISIVGAVSAVPVLHAPGGQHFTGTGYFRAWWQPNLLINPNAVFTREPEADFDMSAGQNETDFAIPGIPFNHRDGRMAWLPESVGVSGGSSMSADFYATGEKGNAI